MKTTTEYINPYIVFEVNDYGIVYSLNILHIFGDILPYNTLLKYVNHDMINVIVKTNIIYPNDGTIRNRVIILFDCVKVYDFTNEENYFNSLNAKLKLYED